jgi:L-alanine-DL-glutamate epimerase-like enolase superfamily enzyme
VYPLAAEKGEIKAQITPLLEQGFKRLKVCVEPWWQDKEKTVSNLEYLRQLVGSNCHLMLDVALELTQLDQLTPFIAILEKLDFKWIEAPFNLENLDDHIALKQLTHIPLGVGDLGMTTCKEFEPYLKANAFDIAQPDISLFGGITEVMALQVLLETQNKRIVPHAYNTDITIAVNSHFLCTQIQQEALEYSTSPSLLRQALIKNPYSIDTNGMVTIAHEQDGLGIKLNWDIIQSCTIR